MERVSASFSPAIYQSEFIHSSEFDEAVENFCEDIFGSGEYSSVARDVILVAYEIELNRAFQHGFILRYDELDEDAYNASKILSTMLEGMIRVISGICGLSKWYLRQSLDGIIGRFPKDLPVFPL